MSEPLICDHVRTPRGRGRNDGCLYTVTRAALPAQVWRGTAPRHTLPADAIADVVIGCVAHAGEQGSDIARSASLPGSLRQRKKHLWPGLGDPLATARAPVVKRMHIAFRRRATGRLTARAMVPDETLAPLRAKAQGEVDVAVQVSDEAGGDVVSCHMVYAWFTRDARSDR